MLAQALTTTPHLFLSGFFGMVYEHLSELFLVVIVVSCGDIPKLVALALGASRLLVMAKDTCGFRLIAIGWVFL